MQENTVINIKQQKITVFNKNKSYVPINFQVDLFIESQEIIYKLSSGQNITVFFEDIDTDLSYRILDFISGITYTLNGEIIRLSKDSFLLTPPKKII